MKLRFKHGQRDALETLHPAYFALVMATGIVALAAQRHGLAVVPGILFWLNALFFIGLTVATALRAWRYPGAFVADLCSHSRGVGFFTVVAACAVFGGQLVLQQGALAPAIFFWVVAGLLWFLVTYGMLAVLTVRPEKPTVADGLNSGWLVSVVATQAISILTVLILPAGVPAALQEPLIFGALVLWLGGGALYLCLMALLLLRYTFLPTSAADLTPSCWINMGAVAISTLAGVTLLDHAALSPIVVELTPFVSGFTLFFWAIGTWWIPLLLVLGVWRYLIREMPFAYDPLYWGCVFPLGMYSTATFHLADVLHAPFLMPLSWTFMLVALAAWAAAFFGFVDSFLASRPSLDLAAGADDGERDRFLE